VEDCGAAVRKVDGVEVVERMVGGVHFTDTNSSEFLTEDALPLSGLATAVLRQHSCIQTRHLANHRPNTTASTLVHFHQLSQRDRATCYVS